jgi:UDPglucose 6-dehydrogenase
MDVIHLRMNDGARVQVYDPALLAHPTEPLRDAVRESPLSAVEGADALAILTDWREFRSVSLVEVREVIRNPVIFDGRNILSRREAEEAGFLYTGVGRVPSPHRRRVSDR